MDSSSMLASVLRNLDHFNAGSASCLHYVIALAFIHCHQRVTSINQMHVIYFL